MANLKIRERQDLQRLLKNQIDVISPGTLVISEEYSGWSGSFAQGSFVTNRRDQLLASGILKDDGTHLFFTEDTPFNSPSGAAMVVLGRTANGWLEWKIANGVPIDRIRKTAEQETAHE